MGHGDAPAFEYVCGLRRASEVREFICKYSTHIYLDDLFRWGIAIIHTIYTLINVNFKIHYLYFK